MLSFATEFPVQATNPAALTDCVAAWLKGSPHSEFSHEEIDSLKRADTRKIERANQSLEVISVTDGSRSGRACKHSALDAGVLWTTTVVCSSDAQAGTWVSIRTERVSIDPTINLKPAKKPVLVRTVLREMGGGLDGEIYVTDTPHFLMENDCNMVVRLLNGDSDNYLPVIYVSRLFNGNLPLDVHALSRTLGGLGHVLVEPSRVFSKKIQYDTGSRNAYGGAVGIYLPSGERWLVLADDLNEQDTRFHIISRVRETLLSRRPRPQCTWDSLEGERSRQEIKRLREQNSTDVDAFTEAFDKENRALHGQLEAADNEISRLKSEVYKLTHLSSGRGENSKGVKIQDFFEGESEHFIHDAISSSLSNNVPAGSRRHEVLTQALENFKTSAQIEKRKQTLKAALKDAKSLDPTIIRILNDLGFEIESSGKHHKLIYNGDEKYTFTMAKSSSDWRAGLNLFSDIAKKIY